MPCAIPGWTEREKALVREYQFNDFAAALAFVNRVGALAEAANHHPDIFLYSWNKVRLTLSTHSAGGLTNNDYAMAGKMNQLGS
ncbi:MAG: 4a-hydroxytetrahydrobiopterin dehydratase [Deltaproteobacteria bacterium]|nr:4a-hydroxytetrahydrobiopterin dehydratase [Deltaproteobacteria bacterium]